MTVCDFVDVTEETDLIYEGIETHIQGAGTGLTRMREETDLIYEGIETPLNSLSFHHDNVRRNRPNLRRD